MTARIDGLEPAPEQLRARTLQIAHQEFVRGATLWRSGPVTVVLCVIYSVSGALPLLPGAASVTGLSIAWTGGFFGTMVALAVTSWAVVRRHTIESPAYAVLSWIEPAFWLVGSCVLVAAEGRVASIYWFDVGVFVVLMSASWKRHHVYRSFLLLGVGGIVAAFVLRSALVDAVFAACLGGTLLLMQALSTVSGRRVDRERARSQLILEASARMQADHERERIARDLHDGLGAELTALAWRASESEEVAGAVQRCMATLRGVIADAQHRDLDGPGLARELGRATEGLAPRIRVDVDAPDGIPGVWAATWIRSAQELTRNAHDHGGARTVDLCVRWDPPRLEVTDDGRWVDQHPGRGLANLRRRAEDLGGTLEVRPGPEGTHVVLALDVREA